jgi:hypothetical protein
MARREEWGQQVLLASLLDKFLDPDRATWTATDPVAASALAGAMRRKRGVKPGVPDTLVWNRGRCIAIEMKSPGGRCSPSQKVMRESLLRAGCVWWECRSANAAMWALAKSGVRFREYIDEDGATARWRQPRLARWEVPRRDPTEERPQHPDIARERNEAARMRRMRRAEEKAATAAAVSPFAATRALNRHATPRNAGHGIVAR